MVHARRGVRGRPPAGCGSTSAPQTGKDRAAKAICDRRRRSTPILVEATPLDGYTVRVRFEDGVGADVDLSYLVDYGGVFKPLSDPGFFRHLSRITACPPTVRGRATEVDEREQAATGTSSRLTCMVASTGSDGATPSPSIACSAPITKRSGAPNTARFTGLRRLGALGSRPVVPMWFQFEKNHPLANPRNLSQIPATRPNPTRVPSPHNPKAAGSNPASAILLPL